MATRAEIKAFFETGDVPTQSNFSDLIDEIFNQKSESLGAITVGAIAMTNSGYYDSLAVSGNIVLSFTGTPVEGTWQKVRTTGWNGSYTLSVPNNAIIVNSSFTQGGAVASGTYDIWIAYVGGEYQINLVSVAVNVVAAPTLSAYAIATANPDRITFSSSEIITGTTFSGFTLGSGKTITGLTINAGQTTGHYFTVSSAYVEGDGNDTIAYSGTGSDIQNALGSALASFTATTVTNNVDSTAPQFVTASFEVGNVADNIVVLPVDEALDPTSVPAVGDFAILVDASPNVVTNVDIATSSTQARLTVTTDITSDQTVTAAYIKGSNPLRDVSLNETPSLTATAVTNNASSVPSLLVPDLEVDGFIGVTEGATFIWADQSVNAGSYFNTTAPTHPTYNSGSGEISFNGTDQYLVLNAALRDILVADDVGEFFIIAKTTDLATELSCFNVSAISTASRFSIRLTSSGMDILCRNNAAWSYVLNCTTTSLSNNTYYIINVSSNGSTIRASINGVEQTLSATLGTNNGDWLNKPDGPVDSAQIGRIRFSSTINYEQGVFKYIFYKGAVLAAGDRSEMLTYLNNRFTVY